ncbi:MAG: ankyrin repeat domain-containing protein [Sideroxydans sp.]|nr:ankyrin repeat domain-containing protein [Sideroxydans sp.]
MKMTILLLASMLLTGCGTVLSRTSDPYAPPEWCSCKGGQKPSRIYSGVITDAKSFTPEGSVVVIADFPFSLTADTLYLPLTIYEQFIAENDLQAAAQKGDISTVSKRLAGSVNINAQDAYGHTALMSAAWAGQTEVIRLLLEKGASVNEQNRYFGTTALMYSVDKPDNVQLLLNSGADANMKNSHDRTALIIAADKSNTAAVKLLLDRGADVNVIDEDGRTALSVALLNKRGRPQKDIAIAQMLLDKGGDMNVTDSHGFTLIDYSLGVYERGSRPGHIGNNAAAVSLLLDKGANPNKTGGCYLSPLMVAAEVDNQAAAKLLLEKGADKNFRVQESNIWWCGFSLKGKTALTIAADNGNAGMVKLLKDAGAVE